MNDIVNNVIALKRIYDRLNFKCECTDHCCDKCKVEIGLLAIKHITEQVFKDIGMEIK